MATMRAVVLDARDRPRRCRSGSCRPPSPGPVRSSSGCERSGSTSPSCTDYAGDASDLPPAVLQEFLDDVTAATAAVPVHQVYPMDEIAQAHADMKAGQATGKLVVIP